LFFWLEPKELKGQGVLKDQTIILLFCILYLETFNFIYVCGKQELKKINVVQRYGQTG